MRCEDYPCCGHTDGLPCDWDSVSVYNDPHLYCDHNTGFCDADYRDYSEEAYNHQLMREE